MGIIDREYLDAKKGDKPTTQDLLLLEVRDLVASVGELRLQLNGVWQRVTALEGRVRNLESGPAWADGAQGLAEKVEKLERDDSTMRRQIGTLARHGVERQTLINALEYDLDNLKQRPMPCTMTGTIQGLDGEFTVTPPPEWGA